jgi:hypothetical protein
MPAAPPVMTAVRPSKSSRFIARAPIEIRGPSYHATCAAKILRRDVQGVNRAIAHGAATKETAGNPKVTGRRDPQIYSRVVVSAAP